MSPRKILITAALPYANSPIHIGHLVEHFQLDFWCRFQRMHGHDCVSVCADDTHGTPVMIAAKKAGITPEQHIAKVWQDHVQDFKDCEVHYDHYSSTNSKANRELCEEFFAKMKSGGHIKVSPVEQLYCNHDKMFLPDRFVIGTCPKCATPDQYGDNCSKCGATYAPTELKSPRCSICSTTPVLKTSDHLLFQLDHFRDDLQKWLPEHTTKEVTNKMLEWFKEPLRDWDISRDAPYFGFEIPGYPQKYFYVWVDAPMGYVSTTKELCDKSGRSFADYWKSDKTEVYHLIGKDIIYFHTLFWPALLKCAGFRTPTQVVVHGHLMVNGEKMSKSKGTQVPVRTYLNHLDINYLRYYFASKMNAGMDDFDFAGKEFSQKVNAELIGKITNLGSRGGQMLKKRLGGKIIEGDAEGIALVKMAQSKAKVIAEFYDSWNFAKAISEIRSLAEEANRYFDAKAPWKTADTDPAGTQKVLSSTLNLFRLIAIYLKPVLPKYAERCEALFKEKNWTWASADKILVNHEISDYEHLAVRIDEEKVKMMFEESLKNSLAGNSGGSSAAPTANPSGSAPAPAGDGTIDIDQFGLVDLRIAKIVEAEEIKEADKLLKLKVDLGPMGTRQIFAGIKAAYTPDKLIGRLTVIVANLKPRKMKFGMSEGMVLAAGPGGKDLFILSPDSGANPGDKVK